MRSKLTFVRARRGRWVSRYSTELAEVRLPLRKHLCDFVRWVDYPLPIWKHLCGGETTLCHYGRIRAYALPNVGDILRCLVAKLRIAQARPSAPIILPTLRVSPTHHYIHRRPLCCRLHIHAVYCVMCGYLCPASWLPVYGYS